MSGYEMILNGMCVLVFLMILGAIFSMELAAISILLFGVCLVIGIPLFILWILWAY